MSRPSPAFWRVLQPVGGAVILAAVIWRLGAGPILAGLRSINARALLAATALTGLTTVCAAWRWSLVARGLGVAVPLPAAVAAYYRSQFLNTALPGGVLGDVHRGVRHGLDAGDVSRGLRAVAWERFAGQVVQVSITLVVILLLPSSLRSAMPAVGAVIVVCALAASLVLLSIPHRWAQILSGDVRAALLARSAWPGIVLASALIVAGHVAAFVIAARTAGSSASLPTLLPLALLVLLAMTVPVNIGGWGPREGVAAWLFGAAGLSADRGVATATVYGVMVLVSCLPGAVVLVVARRRTVPVRAEPEHAWPADRPQVPWPAGAGHRLEGRGHG